VAEDLRRRQVCAFCPDCEAVWPGDDPFEEGAWEKMAAWWEEHRAVHVLLGTDG
jgi:hypothetical protein